MKTPGPFAFLLGMRLLGAGVGALLGTLIKTGEWVPGIVPHVVPGRTGLEFKWTVKVAF
jgi:hypothetical protein